MNYIFLLVDQRLDARKVGRKSRTDKAIAWLRAAPPSVHGYALCHIQELAYKLWIDLFSDDYQLTSLHVSFIFSKILICVSMALIIQT